MGGVKQDKKKRGGLSRQSRSSLQPSSAVPYHILAEQANKYTHFYNNPSLCERHGEISFPQHVFLVILSSFAGNVTPMKV